MQRASMHGSWSSRFAFLLAAIGSAVGLGNIWRFPSAVNENGGAAFLLVYLFFVFAIGVPVMIAELSLGRRGRGSPPATIATVAEDEGKSRRWSFIGWIGMFGAFCALSFYSVIGGWVLNYMVKTLLGGMEGIGPAAATGTYLGMLESAGEMGFWHLAFMGVTAFIVARGIKGGLEKAVTILMPLLFVLLAGLAAYALLTGEAAKAFDFLFSPDFSKITPHVVLSAVGQAFFSLSLGLGTMLAYGAYLPEDVSIPKSAIIIGGADTLVAVCAGLAIYPIFFQYGLDAVIVPGQTDSGEGLVFQVLPIAFGQMPGGQLVGTLFFLLLSIAAITSSISLLEPVVSWLEEHRGLKRSTSAMVGGGAAFLVGLTCVLSFNHWQDIRFLAGTFFDNITYLAFNVITPVSAIFIALFAGWVVARKSMRDELHNVSEGGFNLWYAVVRFFCPIALLLVFLSVTGALG